MELIDKLIYLRILLINSCDGFSISGKNSVLSTKLKILFMLEKGDCSPKDFIDNLCIAKSNIAGIIKKMSQEKLLECYKSDKSTKNVFYKITDNGLAELKQYKDKLLIQLQNKYDSKINELSYHLDSVINILKGTKS